MSRALPPAACAMTHAAKKAVKFTWPVDQLNRCLENPSNCLSVTQLFDLKLSNLYI